MAMVMQLLGYQTTAARGGQQRGPCPLHHSKSATSRCFSVNLDLNCYNCFTCGRHGNALDLWAEATRSSPYEAAIDLCQRLNLDVPYQPPEQNGNRDRTDGLKYGTDR